MDCNCGIYKFTNLVNDKVYIGSSKNLKKRKKDHLNLNIKSGCSFFRKAVVKYGVENFIFEVIECIEDVGDLLKKEQYYLDTILKASLYIKGISNYFIERGYNLSPTARSREGVKELDSSQHYKKIVEYDNNGHFIRVWDSMKEASIAHGISPTRITKSCKSEGRGKYIFRYHSDDYPNIITFKNKKHTKIKSDETRKKIAIAMTGRKSPRRKKIKQLDIQGNLIRIFSSISEAFKMTGISITAISNVLTNRSKTAGTYKWQEC